MGTAGGTASSDLGGGKLSKFLLLVVLGERALNVVLECQVEGGGGDVADAVGDVAAPQRADAKLLDVAYSAVAHAGVALHLTGDDAGVRVLQKAKGKLSTAEESCGNCFDVRLVINIEPRKAVR